MNYTTTIGIIITTTHRTVISSMSLILSLLLLLLIGSTIENAMVHHASAQTIINTSNNNNNKKSSPYTPIDSMLNIGPPDKLTITFNSQQHPSILSAEKRQQLMQHNQPGPQISSPGEPIQGPVPGTQTSLP